MKVIRYGDIFGTDINENGEVEEVLIRSNFTAPISINPHRIETIEPYMGLNCKIFKNVSIITYDSGKQFKVVGNYAKLEDYLFEEEDRIIIKGYGSKT